VNVGIGTNDPTERLTVAGNVVPARSNQYTLGTADLRWNTLYMASKIDHAAGLEFVSDSQTGMALSAGGDLTLNGALYFGDPGADGTWRIVPSGNDLVIEVRKSGTWERRETFSGSIGDSATNPGLSCQDILTKNPGSPSGTYWIDPDSSGALAPFQCYCDMQTDGGGWTLVLNYLHADGTLPALNVRNSNLPLLGSTVLGTDESGTVYWGHAANSLMNTLSFTELRFYGITDAHARKVDFKTSHSGTITYFKTGSGSCSGMQSSYTALPGHTAFLPGVADFCDSNWGDYAPTRRPFINGAAPYYWNIAHEYAPGEGWHWLVDATPADPPDFHSHHQLWVR